VRKKVRSHVMRNFRRDQIMENIKLSSLQDTVSSQPSLNSAAIPNNGPSKSTAPYLNNMICLNCGGLKARSPISTGFPMSRQVEISGLNKPVSTENMDTFNVLPINTIRSSYLLFDHCKHSLKPWDIKSPLAFLFSLCNRES
jgi:hypothetical protein